MIFQFGEPLIHTLCQHSAFVLQSHFTFLWHARRLFWLNFIVLRMMQYRRHESAWRTCIPGLVAHVYDECYGVGHLLK